MELRTQKSNSELPFEVRAISALGISVIVDALDYAGAPIFALPIVGDVVDVIVMTLLYRLTGSKTSAAINTIELIPFVGDFIPTYTITTLVWILRESRKRNNGMHQIINSLTEYDNNTRVIRRGNNNNNGRTMRTRNNESENLRTKLMRAYAIFRSRSSRLEIEN
jgi:hypothetical protein